MVESRTFPAALVTLLLITTRGHKREYFRNYQCSAERQNWKNRVSVSLEPRWIMKRRHNRLDFQVLIQSMHSIVTPKSAHLMPSEGAVLIERIVAVHPYRPSSNRSRLPIRQVQVLGHNPSSQSIPGFICPFNRLIYRPTRSQQLINQTNQARCLHSTTSHYKQGVLMIWHNVFNLQLIISLLMAYKKIEKILKPTWTSWET